MTNVMYLSDAGVPDGVTFSLGSPFCKAWPNHCSCSTVIALLTLYYPGWMFINTLNLFSGQFCTLILVALYVPWQIVAVFESEGCMSQMLLLKLLSHRGRCAMILTWQSGSFACVCDGISVTCLCGCMTMVWKWECDTISVMRCSLMGKFSNEW